MYLKLKRISNKVGGDNIIINVDDISYLQEDNNNKNVTRIKVGDELMTCLVKLDVISNYLPDYEGKAITEL